MRAGRAFRPHHHPRRAPDGWTEQRFHLGNNKEVSNAELFAIHRAMRIFLEREETGVAYTTPSDSTATIERAMMSPCGPRQALTIIINIIIFHLAQEACRLWRN